MNKDINMKVNVLPVLTYNFLHVNDSTLNAGDITIDSLSSPVESVISDEIEVKRDVTFEEAGEIFRANKEKILKTTGVPGIPNGDMSYRDEKQALRTGMGIDIDELMISAGVKAVVYTVPENVKAKRPIVIRYDLANGQGSLSSQVIHARKDSEVTVIMEYSSEKDATGFHGVSTRLLAEEGARIGIHASRTANYVHDREGTRVQYSALADAVSCARSTSSAKAMNAMFDEDKAMAPIREDFRKRGKKKR